MTPYFDEAGVVIYHGDSFDVLPELAAESVDACVTDPPYNLTFMDTSWDTFSEDEDAGFFYWLSGLIDGEGCFMIKAHTRGTHAPSFSLKMRADEEGTLVRIQRTLGVGTLSREERDPNPTVSWTVGDKAGCQRIVDLLDKYPLRAKKHLDYRLWREAVCEWTDRPRGNRWHGPSDNSRMASLRKRLMDGRVYTDVPWTGHAYQDWCRLWASEILRVLKPGGHLLACGAPRSGHRLAAGIEDAGFEIRDALAWYCGQGFPKSKNLGEGRGTALKPGYEPIVMARKPFRGSVTANVEAHGTGGLDIDACRIEPTATESGRWPANVVLGPDGAAELDQQIGELASGANPTRRTAAKLGPIYGEFAGQAECEPARGADRGGPSRFFYVAKPSRAERDLGCDDIALRTPGECTDRTEGSAGITPYAGAGRSGGGRNFHPTVKPLALMRWLVRLVTPPGGVVIDPFLGSGTTGMACALEWLQFIGVERESGYLPISLARIKAVRVQQSLFTGASA